ncbi:MAG: hypothetical protein SAJ12_03840 [Jaaginema sp. PMC 1079.18]|nr:hypothetical protein [Jaaginema sp. PMC 1080.18]MEC4850121.1 hypothetical protein [Jaaginema sp. PMC 1079.18]MEC4864791.1 hypothetical protein [Jaaginema sp. PMC 1078.18]
MASKVFNWVSDAIIRQNISLSFNNLYAHLVTAEPLATAQYLSDCTLATGGNYDYKTLTDIDNNSSNRLALTGDTLKIKMANPVWISLATDSTPITGLIVSTGIYSSDTILAYIERLVGGVPTPYTPNGDPFGFNIQTNGFMQLIANPA